MRFLRALVDGEVVIPWQRVPDPEPQFTEQRWADDYATRETKQERLSWGGIGRFKDHGVLLHEDVEGFAEGLYARMGIDYAAIGIDWGCPDFNAIVHLLPADIPEDQAMLVSGKHAAVLTGIGKPPRNPGGGQR